MAPKAQTPPLPAPNVSVNEEQLASLHSSQQVEKEQASELGLGLVEMIQADFATLYLFSDFTKRSVIR